MGYRKFVDRSGHEWEIRERSRDEWDLVPLPGNPEQTRTARAPGYESDPFELSVEELQRLLDSAPSAGTRRRSSPFAD